MDALRLSVRVHDAQTKIVDLTGEIDVHTAPDLRTNLAAIVDETPSLVVNLTDVRYIDSSGLSVLLEMHKRARARDSRLRIVCDQNQIKKLLALTGLDQILEVHPREVEALSTAPPSA